MLSVRPKEKLPFGAKIVQFLKIFKLLGFRCYLIDSIALKCMLEVWATSFSRTFDRRHKSTGVGGTCTAGCHQGQTEGSIQIAGGGGEKSRISVKNRFFLDFSVAPRPIQSIPDALECSTLDLWNKISIFENIMMGWRQGGG